MRHCPIHIHNWENAFMHTPGEMKQETKDCHLTRDFQYFVNREKNGDGTTEYLQVRRLDFIFMKKSCLCFYQYRDTIELCTFIFLCSLRLSRMPVEVEKWRRMFFFFFHEYGVSRAEVMCAVFYILLSRTLN